MSITVVLGASPKPERYSNKAIRMLKQYGHQVIPVHPLNSQIEGLESVATLGEIHQPIDTLTLYLAPAKSERLASAILALKPTRVIMNPGTESVGLQRQLVDAGIEVVEGCTLVMLRTGQY